MKKYDVLLRGNAHYIAFTAEVDERLVNEPLLMRASVEWAMSKGITLKRTHLRNADLSGLDLSGQNLANTCLGNANLSGTNMSNCDLTGTDFGYANLSGANWTGAILNEDTRFIDADMTGVIYDPAIKVDDLDGKILAAIKKGGTLYMSDWHTCDTTHCRAGWAIVMAGKAGKALEKKVGPAMAGTLIYAASYPMLPIPDFYCSTDEAMADIEEGAARAA